MNLSDDASPAMTQHGGFADDRCRRRFSQELNVQIGRDGQKFHPLQRHDHGVQSSIGDHDQKRTWNGSAWTNMPFVEFHTHTRVASFEAFHAKREMIHHGNAETNGGVEFLGGDARGFAVHAGVAPGCDSWLGLPHDGIRSWLETQSVASCGAMKPPSPPPPALTFDEQQLVRAALSEVAGAAVVLDERLRIIDCTDQAEALVGSSLPRGVAAPDVLCGAGPDRPVADALAAGRPVSATIHRPGADANTGFLSVRAIPLRNGETIAGWLLLLDADELTAGDNDAAVEICGVLTRDKAMKKLLSDVRKVARTNASVLVRGETGSGKELIARAVHSLSARNKGPLRTLNCAALPPALLESELFGHTRGAFTGAVRDQKGHVELAHGGTLFLDEVAELPLELQAKLLRVLQEKVVVPVGGRDPIAVDVRFVAATHRSLRKEVAAGRFRADLMFRLRVVPLFLPPLRSRPADISLLAWRFIERMNAENERHVARLSPGALHALEAYTWPGNVRELMNAIEYAFVMGDGPILTEADLLPEIRGERPAFLDEPEEEPVRGDAPDGRDLGPEEREILEALHKARGNRQEAAALLGYSRITLWRKLKALGLALDEDAAIRHRRRTSGAAEG